MLAAVWASPVLVDGKVYLGDEDGDVVVLAHGKVKKILAENTLGSSVYSTRRPRQRRAPDHEPQPALVAGRSGRGAGSRPVTPFEPRAARAWSSGRARSRAWARSRASWACGARSSSRTRASSPSGTPRARARRSSRRVSRSPTFSAFDHDPTSAMVDAGAPVARAQGVDSLVGLGGGSSMDCAKAHRLPARERRPHAGLPGLRQGEAAAAADDRRSRRRPAPAARRSPTRSSRTTSRTRRWPAATRAPRSASRSSIPSSSSRCRAPMTAATGFDAIAHCGRDLGLERAHARVGPLRARGLSPARRPLRAGARRPEEPRGARGDAARRALGRRGDRGLDARRDARLRQPADGALRHDARGRDRAAAAARGALERRRGGRALRGAARGHRPAARIRGRGAEALAARLEALAVAAGPAARGSQTSVSRRPSCPSSPPRPRCSGPAASTRARSTDRPRRSSTVPRTPDTPAPLPAAGRPGGGRRVARAAPGHAAASASAIAPADAWPQFRGTPSLSGLSATKLGEKLSVAWEWEAGDAVESSAAIAAGVVYVGTRAGELVALDLASGKPLWRYKVTGDGIGESSPCVAGGAVFVGDLGGQLHAVDAATGKGLWTHKTGQEIKSSPVRGGRPRARRLLRPVALRVRREERPRGVEARDGRPGPRHAFRGRRHHLRLRLRRGAARRSASPTAASCSRSRRAATPAPRPRSPAAAPSTATSRTRCWPWTSRRASRPGATSTRSGSSRSTPRPRCPRAG